MSRHVWLVYPTKHFTAVTPKRRRMFKGVFDHLTRGGATVWYKPIYQARPDRLFQKEFGMGVVTNDLAYTFKGGFAGMVIFTTHDERATVFIGEFLNRQSPRTILVVTAHGYCVWRSKVRSSLGGNYAMCERTEVHDCVLGYNRYIAGVIGDSKCGRSRNIKQHRPVDPDELGFNLYPEDWQ